MNACIRAVVRSGLREGLEVFGAGRGFEGLVDDLIHPLSSDDVSNIIQRGGTILHAARCPRFLAAEGRARAASSLRSAAIDGLVVIGGDGSFRGADALCREHGIDVIGVPGTIDNDLWGSDRTIGFDTAVNTAIEAMDRIKDTASAHDRLFIVEVMGRDAGFIALEASVAVGAEAVLVPETPTDLEAISRTIRKRIDSGRTGNILVVAEGDESGNAVEIAALMKRDFDIESHVTILGHIQRGGPPTAADRALASKLGWAAIAALLEGAAPCMVGEMAGEVVRHPLADSWTMKKPLDDLLVLLSERLR